MMELQNIDLNVWDYKWIIELSICLTWLLTHQEKIKLSDYEGIPISVCRLTWHQLTFCSDCIGEKLSQWRGLENAEPQTQLL